ncbi:MAG: DUF4843 domain-containing protein [Duncaniella sp.]|nr:DUF4843 domain-containing protein [Duncaniella sp.]
MKKLSYIASLVIAFSAMTTSCSTEDIETYSGVKSGIFIQEIYSTDLYGNPMSYRLLREYSFSGLDESRTSLNGQFIVRTMGGIVNYDRPYKIEVVEDETTAIEGEDFVLPANPVIPAGSATAPCIIQLNRTPKLLGGEIQVTVRIVPNEYFDTPIEEYKNSSSWNVDADMQTATQFTLKFHEKYGKPGAWSSFYGDPALGNYSYAKLTVVNKAMGKGWTYSTWQDGVTIKAGQFDFIALRTRDYLQALADAGTPVLDEDGSYMQLGRNFQVNYSAYITPEE